MTIFGQGDAKDRDWKVEVDNSTFTITDLSTGKSSVHTLNNFSFIHNSLLRLGLGSGETTLQFMGSQNDLKFDFYYNGGKVNTMIYDEVQFKH